MAFISSLQEDDKIGCVVFGVEGWIPTCFKVCAIDNEEGNEDKCGFVFNFDKNLLRKETFNKASNSWAKCKKKLIVEENEYYIGIKGLFHSFRIPMFDIQIAIEGRIKTHIENTNHLTHFVQRAII